MLLTGLQVKGWLPSLSPGNRVARGDAEGSGGGRYTVKKGSRVSRLQRGCH